MPPMQKLLCPDCGEWIKQPDFVAHREWEHPPAPRELATAGINTQAKFGTDPHEE